MAAATAIIGTGLALGSSAMSFSQYSQQNKAQKEAEAAADKAMKEARAKLEENVYKGLDINLKSSRCRRTTCNCGSGIRKRSCSNGGTCRNGKCRTSAKHSR